MQGGTERDVANVDTTEAQAAAEELQRKNSAAQAELLTMSRHLHVFPELLEFPMRLGVSERCSMETFCSPGSPACG